MPWGLTPAHLIIVLVIVLIVVGPGKLPDTGAAIGKALRGFKDAMDGAGDGQTTQQPDQPPVAQMQQPQQAAPVQPPAGYPPQYAAPQQPYPPQYPPGLPAAATRSRATRPRPTRSRAIRPRPTRRASPASRWPHRSPTRASRSSPSGPRSSRSSRARRSSRPRAELATYSRSVALLRGAPAFCVARRPGWAVPVPVAAKLWR